MTSSYKYKAFISYSHSDKAAADRLLNKLENYRVPKRLVGISGTDGATIQNRVGQIFRDRDELPAAEDLTAEVKKALTQSEFMIVLCSPAAAASRWVNREIIEFKKLTGERRILSVILSGEPFATDKGQPEDECFPPALRFKLGKNGQLTKTPAEPLAADFRAIADGERRGMLKLVAGLLGIGLDALIERDLQRKIRRVTAVTAASVVAMLGMGLLTYEAVDARQEAEHHRSEAEGQIDFMMTDLWGIFRSMGRSDAAYAIAQNAAEYYQSTPFFESQNIAAEEDEKRLSQMFHNWISTAMERGEYDDARGWLNRIWHRNAVRLNRSCDRKMIDVQKEPDSEFQNPADVEVCSKQQDIFDFSQSEFWVGELNRLRGSKSIALAKFEEYKNWSLRLVDLDPNNPAWQLEAGWGYQNVGTQYLRALQRPEIAWQNFEDAPIHFQTAIQLYELQKTAAEKACLSLGEEKHSCNVKQAESAIRSSNLALAILHAWRADTLSEFAPLNEAIAERTKQLQIYEKLQIEYSAKQAPDLPSSEKIDYYVRARECEALLAMSRLLFDTGKTEQAISTLLDAQNKLQVLVQRDSDNADLIKQSALLILVEAEFRFDLGQISLARELLSQVEDTKKHLLELLRSKTDLLKELRKQTSISPKLSLDQPREIILQGVAANTALEERILLGNRYADLLTLRPLVLTAKLALQNRELEAAGLSLKSLTQELSGREDSAEVTGFKAAQLTLSDELMAVLSEPSSSENSVPNSEIVIALLAPLKNNTRPEKVFLFLKAQYANGQTENALNTARLLMRRGYQRPDFIRFVQQNFTDEIHAN